jgi:hypothetical protein
VLIDLEHAVRRVRAERYERQRVEPFALRTVHLRKSATSLPATAVDSHLRHGDRWRSSTSSSATGRIARATK